MITATSLIIRYESALAVDDLSLEVRQRRVTGFLGPNQAGKSDDEDGPRP
jgi:ABC-2 type transport system ATP-binding protein